MNRRHFLQTSFLAAAFAPLARASSSVDIPRVAAGFKVGAGADRSGEELLIMGGRFNLKVSARDTGGDLCIYDTYRDSKGGPALHRHFYQDEWFYVTRGEFVARVGEQTLTLGPGDSAFAPRKIPHTFAMTSEGEGQMLVLFQPAGTMEDFFHGMARFGKTIPKNQENVLKQLWLDHGMEVLGPPLKI
ncbi:MAG TPA: cupin domain-containing protein [Opitutus sp.]|nr:cupin domain-containing protein [Opitutus sp.]